LGRTIAVRHDGSCHCYYSGRGDRGGKINKTIMAEKLGGDRLVVFQVWLPISPPSEHEILIYL